MSEHEAARGFEQAAAMVVALRECVGGRDAGGGESIARALSAMRSYGLSAGLPFTILLAPSAVLVGGRFLRAPRWVHDAADELRAGLAACGIAELVVAADPGQGDLEALRAQVLAQAHEERGAGALQWRCVQPLALVRGIDLELLDPEQHFETAYGWAVAALRRLTAELHAGSGAELRARQIARTLIALPANDLMALMHSDRVRTRLTDPAERAIGRTILAIAMMRALTADRSVLADVAMVSMLMEAIAGPSGAPVRTHPSAGAQKLLAISRTDDSSVMRAVIAYEAMWMDQQASLGPVWAGERPASAHSCVVHAAMRCFARPDLSMQDAIASLHADARTDRARAAVRLLCSITGNPVPASAPQPSPVPEASRRSPLPPGAAFQPATPRLDAPRETFSDQEVADIFADLGGVASIRPSAHAPRSARTPSGHPEDGRASHAPVARTSDAPKRPSGPPSVVPGNLVSEEQRTAGAEGEFDEAEAAYAMGEIEEALTHADAAVMLSPQRARYVALQAYLEAIQDEKTASDAASLIERVDRVMVGPQRDARAHYYRGMLLRCAGKTFAARQAFRRGIEIAPDDPDLRNALEER